MIDTEAPEAGLAGRLDVPCGEAPVVDVVGHRLMDLGGEDDPPAPGRILGEPFSEETLRGPDAEAAAILVRRIDEVDPRLEGVAEDGEALLAGGHRAEIHGAQADLADLQGGAPQAAVLHGALRVGPVTRVSLESSTQ